MSNITGEQVDNIQKVLKGITVEENITRQLKDLGYEKATYEYISPKTTITFISSLDTVVTLIINDKPSDELLKVLRE